MKKTVVVLTGAGISADSGLATFRNSDGLWANHRVEDICTVEALYRNRDLVIDFYNHRRKEMLEAQPNAAHYSLVELEEKFNTYIINGWEQAKDSKHIDGSLLRPFIVFFGEPVPNMDIAVDIARKADILIIIGTSLNVYPAASLVHFVENNVPIYIVDPALNDKDSVLQYPNVPNIIYPYPYRASVGVPLLVKDLLNK